MQDKTEFIARLSISRSHGGDEKTPMSVYVEDDTSGTRIFEAYFTLADFMSALTGSYGVRGKAKLFHGPVGFKQETKTEVVPRPKGYKTDPKEIEVLFTPFEIDGWRGDVSDAYNHHHWVGENKVSVGFRRYVNAEGKIWEEQNEKV
jgi:hypothetical protein